LNISLNALQQSMHVQRVIVTNSASQVVLEKRINDSMPNVSDIDTSDLSPGTYYIQIILENGSSRGYTFTVI